MSMWKIGSMLSDPSWRRGAIAVAATVAAILVGSAAMIVIGLLRRASALGGFGPWGVAVVLIVSLGIGAGVWFLGRRDPARAPVHHAPAPIPPPISPRGAPAPDLTRWEELAEEDVPSLKARFSRRLEAEEFVEAEDLLSKLRGMGQAKWVDQNLELLAYKRRQSPKGGDQP